MRVGWLADRVEIPGGAELTQAEFRSKAPAGVEVIDCPAGAVLPGLDTYVIHNCVTYSIADIQMTQDRPLVKYVHDVWPHGDLAVREYLLASSRLIFCSPMQVGAITGSGVELDSDLYELIPPAIDLEKFEAAAQTAPRPNSNICVGAFMNPGKGGHLVAEWAEQNGVVDYYGFGLFGPEESSFVHHHGPAHPDKIAHLLGLYERFVFLPTVMEPFGRCVVEAWAAGCELVLNLNIGAQWWIDHRPEAIGTAGEDFWAVVQR